MRSKRFERVERKGKWTTARDLEIVKAVYEARYMTVKQIQRIFFGSATRAKTRIRLLFDKGYLRKRKTYPNEPDIYFLGIKGIHELLPRDEWGKGAGTNEAGTAGQNATLPLLMMKHDLALSGVYAEARVECVRRGWSLEWKNARMLESEKLGVQPDAYFRVSKGDKHREAYIEYTAAITSTAEIKKKIVAYEKLLTTPGAIPVPIVWFLSSEPKVDSIFRSIRESKYADYFLAGSIDKVEGFLTSPMWKWVKSNEFISFIEAPKNDQRPDMPLVRQ